MTIPHMMNCPHSPDGWCLGCVVELVNTKDARIAELEANEKAYERILGPKSYQELADEIARLREQLHIAHRAIDSANKHGVCRTGTTRGCNWRLVHAEAIRAIGKE